jgi:hypothetical protein
MGQKPMKRALLLTLALSCAACSKYGCAFTDAVSVSAMCNNGGNDTRVIVGIHEFSDAEIDELVKRTEKNLCTREGDGGVFHKRKVFAY